MKRLIFTDLDGTFLNHHDYSYKDSKEALLKIRCNSIPLIFTTSKTKEEVLKLQKEVGIKEPFIIENGAALYIPKNYQNLDLEPLDELDGYKVLVFGIKYEKILQFYKKYKKIYYLKGFSDMSLDEICYLTGLDLDNARLSACRGFSEPFIMDDTSKLEDLKKAESAHGIKITKGGRFFHMIGEDQDKGIAVRETIKLFEKLYGEKVNSIALGDGANDIAMFENVTTPVVIKNHEGDYVECSIENIQRSSMKGSAGFNEMVLKNVK